MLIAAFDLGTVTTRLMVGRVVSSAAEAQKNAAMQAPKNGVVEVLERALAITHMGEGLDASGLISNAAQTRLLDALRQFDRLLDTRVRPLLCQQKGEQLHIKAVATSAMRDAANAPEVLAALRKAGFEVEVISGPREAELSFLGTLSGFSAPAGSALSGSAPAGSSLVGSLPAGSSLAGSLPAGVSSAGFALADPVLSFDVGGGSSELIYGTAAGTIQAAHSFNLGSRRVTERFLASDPPTPLELSAARAWVCGQVAPYFTALPVLPAQVLAVAGTATSAITVRDALAVYDPLLVHGKRLTAVELANLVATLAALPLSQRQVVCGLEPKRAPVIVGGLLVLEELLKASGCYSLLVSDTDILQGIIISETYAQL